MLEIWNNGMKKGLINRLDVAQERVSELETLSTFALGSWATVWMTGFYPRDLAHWLCLPSRPPVAWLCSLSRALCPREGPPSFAQTWAWLLLGRLLAFSPLFKVIYFHGAGVVHTKQKSVLFCRRETETFSKSFPAMDIFSTAPSDQTDGI